MIGELWLLGKKYGIIVIGMFSNNRIYIIIKVRLSAYNDNRKICYNYFGGTNY